MSNEMNVLIWLIVAVILAVYEGVTVQLVSIWFVMGTIPTMIVTYFGAPLSVQLIVFLVCSIIALLIIRPIAKKRVTAKKQPTNADRVIGMKGIVLEEVNNLMENGRVMADGLTWTARSPQDEVVIPKGKEIKVLAIDGVKLIVDCV